MSPADRRIDADTPPTDPAAVSDWAVPPPPAEQPTPAGAATEPVVVAPPAVAGYQLLRRLGRGGMGEVYEALHLRLGRRVALKFLDAAWAHDAEAVARFRTEAAALARVQHPNVVQIFEAGAAAGRPFLALELVAGGSLAEALRAGPLPPREAARLVRDLARALQAVHAAGVIHRDLKPANVLLSAESDPPGTRHPAPGTPKVTDFGLANLALGEQHLTRTGVVLGTPTYMAPEQAAGAGAGPAADVYALGAILYECLTGRPPFVAAAVPETLALLRSTDPVPPRRLQPGLPRDLETIVLTCLRKTPDRRFGSAAALADDLDRFLAGEPIRARPAGPVERGLKWCRRRPAAAALLAVTAFATAAGVAAYQVAQRDALRRVAAEKDRAAEQYREARATFQHMLARFDERRYAEVPQALELRNAQFEDALRFYARVVERQDDPDPEIRRDVAAAHVGAARLQMTLGRTAEAEANLRAALAGYARLESDTPGRPETAAGRAGALLALASLKPRPAGFDSARALEEAACLYERAVADEPGCADYRDGLAAVWNGLGCVRLDAHAPEAAYDLMRRAADLREPLVRAEPANRARRLALAENLLNMTVIAQMLRRPADADHDRAANHFDQLLRDDPNDVKAAYRLAALRVNWAYALADRGKADEALADLRASQRQLQPMLAAEPKHVGLRDALYRTFGAQANLLDRLERFADAAAAYERVVELAADGHDFHWLSLGLLLARAGTVERATALADEQVPRIPAENARNWYTGLPWIYALAAAAARTDDRLSPGERAERVAHAARQAAAVVGRAGQRLTPDEWRKYRAELEGIPDYRLILELEGVRQRLETDRP